MPKPRSSEIATGAEPWEFAGWGRAERIRNLRSTTLKRLDQPHRHTLGTWRATAICGNDITSSVLYVSALCAAKAGVLAPVVLVIVAGVLFLYRKVYAEVGSALPLNRPRGRSARRLRRAVRAEHLSGTGACQRTAPRPPRISRMPPWHDKCTATERSAERTGMDTRSEDRRRRGKALEISGGCRAARSALLSALAESPLFCDVPEAALQDLLGAFRTETWQARSPAMTPAHTAQRFYVIVAGRLKVCRINPETGREVGLMLLGPGDAFDVVSLLDGEPLAGSTQALDDLEVVSAPLRRVREWRDEHPEFDRALHPYLARQLRSLADLASELALYDTDVRLARLILRQAVPDRPEMAPRPIDDLSHETLASLIGSVRVVVNRHIQDLKRDGVISVRRGHLAVEDLGSLTRRCRNPVRAARRARPERDSPQPELQTPAP